MDQYGILEAVESYATSQGWEFIYGIDEFYRSIETNQQFDPGKIVLIFAFRALPTKVNGRTTEIRYTCLMMLGRKFDDNGEAASLDETNRQKYDRRLKDLMQFLDIAIGQIACDNELDLEPGEIVPDINQYVANIDFVVSSNTVFIQ